MADNVTVFAGNLPWSATDEDLGIFMSKIHPVVHAEVKRHENTLRLKGWGYIYICIM